MKVHVWEPPSGITESTEILPMWYIHLPTSDNLNSRSKWVTATDELGRWITRCRLSCDSSIYLYLINLPKSLYTTDGDVIDVICGRPGVYDSENGDLLLLGETR